MEESTLKLAFRDWISDYQEIPEQTIHVTWTPKQDIVEMRNSINNCFMKKDSFGVLREERNKHLRNVNMGIIRGGGMELFRKLRLSPSFIGLALELSNCKGNKKT